jgi:hypothetical protein
MIRNSATPLAGRKPSDAWVTRLLNCHSGRLITTWTTLLKAGRHKADSYEKYRVYFNLADPKMAQYELLPENTYNMDEKGLAIGVTGRSKRIFDKVLYGKKQFRQSLHDGNREWVTLASARMGQLFHQASSIQLLEELGCLNHTKRAPCALHYIN